ncbi:transmembrane protein 154 isoform X3 [Erpetoichthys calabaricus]|uniref:transmembrane protein 154 isoform X3 n=1 Tax=Erpetoichthys calabaricus TaxID=27687 RepID=UPI002234B3A2|nr:transmembrane protein 154 isoform X3 [Erpetoichthys calabaricus]
MPALDRSTGRRHEREMVLLAVLLVSIIVGTEYEKELEPLRGDDMDADKPDSPKFEDDIPSVLELEMEDLEKWMNTPQKESQPGVLPAAKEEQSKEEES